MSEVDVWIIVVYFCIVIALGFWYRRRAARDLGAYFLGGKSIHWLGLAMSGSVSNFDITGTMWIISILYVLGFKSMWHHWMWGFLMGAFFLAYMGKWVRRSNVMTAAEWMRTRFGDGPAGNLARTAYAIMAVLTLASFVGYAFQGIGKFASVYIPLESLAAQSSVKWLQTVFVAHEADVLALGIISLTTLYVMLGGLYSVVITDIIQTVILTVASISIAFVAWSRLDPEFLASLASEWTSLRPRWRVEEFAALNDAGSQLFGAFVIAWVVKGLLLNAGGPAQMYDFQRFLAARDARDAAKVGAAWSFFLVVRWAMAVGVVLLALSGVAGVTDTEKVMPVVLLKLLPTGLRGIVIAGLLAAFMSTFSSTVNSGASFIVRDLWQEYCRPGATERQSVRFSYIATVLLVVLGLAIGLQAGSIAGIWNWMMMALGAGVVVPNVLRWYWWRMNGWGYAAGTFAGILLSVVALLYPQIPAYYVFAATCAASLAVSVAVSLATAPVADSVLVSFYESVRPFGAWGAVRRHGGLSPGERALKGESLAVTALNVVVAMAGICGLYLFPMYLVGHWYARAGLWFCVAGAAMVILRFTWYPNLPARGAGADQPE